MMARSEVKFRFSLGNILNVYTRLFKILAVLKEADDLKAPIRP